MTTTEDITKAIKADVDVSSLSAVDQTIATKMTTLVKGVGFANTEKATSFGSTGNAPLTDPDAVFSRAMRAEQAWRGAIKKSYADPQSVVKSWNGEFAGQFGAFLAANPTNQMMAQWVGGLQQQISEAIGKNITLTSPLSSGLVPFNLVAPSRLIYPVYTPIRNKLPRTQGMGTSYRQKVILGISGSQTGPSGGKFLDLGIPEFQGGGSIANNWPLNIPPSGTQDAVDVNVPYRFSGLSESVSWLSQFAGQGFEDVAALANLMLLQEFMLGEEAAYVSASSIALTTPSAPTLAARTANTGEVGLSGVTTNVYVKVTATNYFGETAASSAGSVAATNGQVVDVAITPVTGALAYNLYVSTGASAGTFYIGKVGVGGVNFTLQGAVPTTGTTAPSSDSGTSSSTRIEGLVPTLSGLSASGGSPIYPSGWKGGYVNSSVGDTLNSNVLNNALQGMWDGSGAFRADPAELIAEGGDLMRLSNDIIKAGSNTNYRLQIQQGELTGVRAGAAVSEFVNPITRSIVRAVVHPFFQQGTALLMTYQLPFAWSNVANAFEVNLVQDYISVSWPVIDATYRYSMYTFGALGANAPQYSGLLQGLQVSDRSGTTGTWA